MRKDTFDIEDRIPCWDVFIDNISYHIEYDINNEILYLYIPQTFIICSAQKLATSYPELMCLDRGLLYVEILRFIDSQSPIKSSKNDSTGLRYAPQPISPIEDVYQIAYDKRTDILYMLLPSRNLHIDFTTALILYPDLEQMHQGILWDVVCDFIERCKQ